MRQLDYGATLGLIFQAWWKNLPLLGGLTALFNVVPLILHAWKIPQPSFEEMFIPQPPEAIQEQVIWMWILMPVQVGCAALALGAVTNAALDRLANRPATVLQGSLAALRWFPHSMLYYLMMSVATACCCVPGLVLGMLYLPYLAVAQSERAGFFGSFPRAYALCEGSRVAIVLVMIVVLVLCVSMILVGFAQIFIEGWLRAVIALVMQSVIFPLLVLPGPVVYHQLITLRMGTSDHQLEETFD